MLKAFEIFKNMHFDIFFSFICQKKLILTYIINELTGCVICIVLTCRHVGLMLKIFAICDFIQIIQIFTDLCYFELFKLFENSIYILG